MALVLPASLQAYCICFQFQYETSSPELYMDDVVDLVPIQLEFTAYVLAYDMAMYQPEEAQSRLLRKLIFAGHLERESLAKSTEVADIKKRSTELQCNEIGIRAAQLEMNIAHLEQMLFEASMAGDDRIASEKKRLTGGQ